MKKQIYFFAWTLFILIIFSCRNDYNSEIVSKKEDNFNQLRSYKVSLNRSPNKEQLFKQLRNVKTNLISLKPKNTDGRIINYGDSISIDTDNVIFIENGPNYHTYTFRIDRHNSYPNALIENLLLTPLPDGSYREFLITYNLTEKEKSDITNGIGVDTNSKTTITELTKGTYNSNNQLGRSVCGFTSQTIWKSCCHGVHNQSNLDDWINCSCSGEGLPAVYTVTVWQCVEKPDKELVNTDIGIGVGGTGGSGNDDPNGGSNNDCDTTIPTNPQTGFYDENGCPIGNPTQPNIPIKNICDDLNSKSTDNEFLGKMQELKQDANGIAEAGMTMYNDSPKYGNKQYGGLDSNGASYVKLDIDWNRAPNITGFMHCHLNTTAIKTLTVFSMSDFVALAQLVQNSNVSINQLGMYVTTNRGTFAIKLTEKHAIIDFANYILANQEYVNTVYQKDIKSNMSKKQQVKGLLGLIRDSGVDAGIELYESDSDFKNWKRQYLDTNDNLKTENCN